MTRVLQIGNFKPDNSTENDLLHALRELNVEVITVQEDDWRDRTVDLPEEPFDMVLWTKTWDVGNQADQLQGFRDSDVPIVGYHLDRWSGLHEPTAGRPLGRQNEIYTAPYFRWLHIFFTADPQERMWRAAHINPVWTPPAISTRWTFDAEPNPRRWDFDVVFVGAWRSYHVEHTHRRVMLAELQKRFGRRFGMLPPGNVRITPPDLNELYATVPVVVGDSCLVGLDPYWCVDDQTEALTTEGWKTYDQIEIGDIVYTLNTESMLGEWQPVTDLGRFEVKNEEMWSMESRAHSSLTTMNHRWFVERSTSRRIERATRLDCEVCGYVSGADDPLWGLAIHRRKAHDLSTHMRKEKVVEPAWRESRDLHKADRIPVAAPCSTLPREAKWSDAFVELVAWAWTEGDMNADRYRGILQSHKVNSGYCDRIRACLTMLYGPGTENMRHVPKGVPAWKEYRWPDGMTRFSINRALSSLLWDVTPDHRPEPWFIAQLTSAQLHLFVETSIDADGSRKTSTKGNSTATGTTFYQKDPGRVDGFEMACALLGWGTKWSKQDDGWLIHVKSRKWTTPMRPDLPLGRCGVTEYSGIVWCPTTTNGTWLARRNGTTYFTGNSDRVPETIGRGGFLVHPATHWNGHYEPGEHLLTFRAGDWDEMEAVIRDALADPTRRERIAAQGAFHVRSYHTYTRRMQQMLEVVL